MKKKYATIVSGLTTMVDQLDALTVQEQAAIEASAKRVAAEYSKQEASQKEINSATKTADAIRNLIA